MRNEAALNAVELQVQRPMSDWCSDADLPPCPPGETPGPAEAEGWDDWGPFYGAMYAQQVGLNALHRRDVPAREPVRRQGGRPAGPVRPELVDPAVRRGQPPRRALRPARDLPPRRHERASARVLAAALRRRQPLDDGGTQGRRAPGQ